LIGPSTAGAGTCPRAPNDPAEPTDAPTSDLIEIGPRERLIDAPKIGRHRLGKEPAGRQAIT
jgi:hypothetical protein